MIFLARPSPSPPPVVFSETSHLNFVSSRDRPLSAATLIKFYKGENGDHTGEFSILKNILCPVLGNGEEATGFIGLTATLSRTTTMFGSYRPER